MDKNFRKYDVDWWSIRKSTIYGVIAIVVSIGLLVGGGWWLWQNDWIISPPNDESAPKDSATIISFEGNVRIIRVSTRETERVTKSTFVQAGDTVQTQADGRAQIRMIDGSTVSVRPNSTVVIRDSTSILGGTSVRVKLDDGQIRVRTVGQNKSSNNVVEMKQSENRLLSQTEASFNIDPKTNNGEIRINRGGVESTVGGKTLSLKENEFVAIIKDKFASRERLLRAPVLKAPSPSQQIPASGGSGANVRFGWRKPPEQGNAKYQIQVAASPFFVAGKIVSERASLANSSFMLSSLAPGTYFWRVSASIESGQVSDWSEPSKFSIIKRQNSSRIVASDWDVEKVGGRVYIIRGKTRSGATVRILGRETFAKSDGAFRVQIASSSSSVTVEIYDETGNKNRYVVSLKTGKVTG